MGISSLFNWIKENLEETDNSNDSKYRNFIDNVLPTLKFGDIIYAERYNNDIQKEIMGEGHSTGPYIVISFDEDKIVGAYCTSNENVKGGLQIGEYYNLFNRDKNSYMTLSQLKTIDYEAYIDKHNKSLSPIDSKKIMKRICLTNAKHRYDDFCLQKELKVNFDVEFEIGDIVSYEKSTYIIVEKKDNDKFVIVSITDHNCRSSYLDFSKAKIEYSNTKEVSKKSMMYFNSVPRQQIPIIISKYNEYIKKKNEIIGSNTKKLERGYIVNTPDGYYYVYGIESNIAHTFSVIEKISIDGNITILGKKFTPNYDEELDIDIKNGDYQIIGVASEKEIDLIKELRKSYKKAKKEEEKAEKINSINTLVRTELVVSSKDNPHNRYLIYKEYEKVYMVIPVSQLLTGEKIRTSYIPKNAVIKVKNLTIPELKIIRKRLLLPENIKYSQKILKKQKTSQN